MKEKLSSEDESLLRAYLADNYTLYDRPTSGRHRAPASPYRMKVALAVLALATVVMVNAESGEAVSETSAVIVAAKAVPADHSHDRSDLIGRADRSTRPPLVDPQPQTRDVVELRKSPPPPPRWVKPLSSYEVTSCYGMRWGRMHTGIDLANRTGTPIFAVGEGVVVKSGWVWSGYGMMVVIDHGGWATLYAHASKVVVQPGQRVRAGQTIALVGSTGNSTGPHLHFSAIQGQARQWPLNFVNPKPWLAERGVDIGGC